MCMVLKAFLARSDNCRDRLAQVYVWNRCAQALIIGDKFVALTVGVVFGNMDVYRGCRPLFTGCSWRLWQRIVH